MIQWNVFTPWIWCVSLHPKPLKASRWGKGHDLTKHLYRYANDRSSDKLWWKIEAKIHVWQTKQALASLHLPQIQPKVTPMPQLHHTFCFLYDIECLAFIVVSSIWRRNWASTPCGLVTCRPWWASASCLGVPCLEGEAGVSIFIQQI